MKRVIVAAAIALAFVAHDARAQWSGHDGWVEETNGKTLADDPGHSYLDPASVHRGDDGLVYFNESNGVTKPEEIGRAGFMKDAYDCTRNIKYMCVGTGDWRNDQSSAIHTANDPALRIYRKYLCNDDAAGESAAGSESTKR
jgi:hypothetical protein